MVGTVRFEMSALQAREAFKAHLDPTLRDSGAEIGKDRLVEEKRNVPPWLGSLFVTLKIAVLEGALSQCLVLARLVADPVEAVCRNEGGLVHPPAMIGLKIQGYDSVYKKFGIQR
jgi:hypothetical protein